MIIGPTLSWASEYVGLPFAEHGRARSGVDCWGLVILVYRDLLGVELPSYADGYHSTRDAPLVAGLVDSESRSWSPLVRGDEQPGDVVVLRVRGLPCHVGVVAGNGMFLHSEVNVGSVLDNYAGPRWKHRVIGFYRHERLAQNQPVC